MKLSKIGEFGLIDLISKRESKRRDTVIGIGDDCAVLRTARLQDRKTAGLYQLITTDAMIENVHFKRKGISFFKLGQKAMIANVSDISSMGGSPTHALITVGTPGNVPVEKLIELYKGIDSLAKKHKIDIVGGDTVASPKEIVISITLLGEVEKDLMLTRSGAKVGDLICVTGKFGGEAARKFDIRKWKVESRALEARIIAKSRIATSMIDSSDGLVRSVVELCKASKTGAMIDEECVPIAKGATLEQALYGGEEYELVFTVPFNKVKDIYRKLQGKISIVGSIEKRADGIRSIGLNGKMKKTKGGYEHFR